MSAIDDGGPVYPTPEKPKRFVGGVWLDNSGMTLRDWFAGQVDVSVYNPLAIFVKAYGKDPTSVELAEWISHIRLTEADAMLAARKGGAND